MLNLSKQELEYLREAIRLLAWVRIQHSAPNNEIKSLFDIQEKVIRELDNKLACT